MAPKGFVPPLPIEDEMSVEAMAQTIVDARGQEMATTGGFGLERDADRDGVARIVATTFCGYFGMEVSDRFEDLFEQCAYLAEHIARDHVFLDGNKRTAVRMSLSILAMRGIVLDVDDSPDPSGNEVYQWVQALVERKIDSSDLAFLFRWRAVDEG